MKIKNIVLNNYRLYKGINEISFSTDSDKNIYLVSGQNGFGKTTFLQSLIWCLYGKLMGDVDESIRKDLFNKGGYSTFLQNNLNHEQRLFIDDNVSKEQLQSIKRRGYLQDEIEIRNKSSYHVSIEFTDVYIPSIPCRSLMITRNYDTILDKENVEIQIDGMHNELSDEIGCDVFINDFILNKDIARFFFFDSEKIVNLAETSTIEDKRKLASAYNEVLGVKKYEDLKNNLENLRLRFRKQSDDLESKNKINKLLETKNRLIESIDEISIKIKEFEQTLDSLRKQNDSFQEALLREGNSTTHNELERIKKVVEVTKNKDEEYKQKLKTFLEFAPFAISGNLLLKTKLQIEHDYKINQAEQNVVNQNKLIENIVQDLISTFDNIPLEKSISEKVKNNIDFVLNKYKKEEIVDDKLINVDTKIYNEFMSIYSNIVGTYKVEFVRLIDDYKKNKQILERNSRQISIIQNKEKDLVIKNIRKQKNIIENKIAETEQNIRALFESKGNLNKELLTINKSISEIIKKVDLQGDNVKKDSLVEQLINELNIFLYSLKQEKKYSLEHRICKIMNTLMHKEDFVDKVNVLIIDDGIDINLYMRDGKLIRKDSLSKGEQQLYATSILKAFVEESGIEFPIFIDSPLQKFDKSHSNRIITEFYPTISKQVILFPLLHKELTKQELELMKPLINSTYLIMNENTHSYFKFTDVERLMEE